MNICYETGTLELNRTKLVEKSHAISYSGISKRFVKNILVLEKRFARCAGKATVDSIPVFEEEYIATSMLLAYLHRF